MLVKGSEDGVSLMARISVREALVGGLKGWCLSKNKSVSRVQGELFNMSGKARVNLGIQVLERSQGVRPGLIKLRAVGTSPQAVMGPGRQMSMVAGGGW